MREFPPALTDHLQQPVTTLCRLLRITLRDGRVFGMTTHDVDVIYGGVTYSAANGFDSRVIASDIGLSVDNSEAYLLLSTEVPGITLGMVAAGDLDDAQWELLIINWRDHGAVAVLDAGDLGRVSTKDGQIFAPELVSYAMRLRQPIGTLDSRTCRAGFGNPPEGQYGCGVDADALWVAGTVTGVSEDEPYLAFADVGLDFPTAPIPGRVRWLTGANASQNRMYQIDAYSNPSGTVALLEPLPFPIALGDEFEIRPDCAKTATACKAYGNLINMRGEPFIPTADGLETSTPNAQIVGGVTGSEIIEP